MRAPDKLGELEEYKDTRYALPPPHTHTLARARTHTHTYILGQVETHNGASKNERYV